MIPEIRPFDPTTEYFFEEGCFITELSNSGDDHALSIARARVKPGVNTQWHKLANTAERYVILQGEGLVELGDNPPQAVANGDTVLIPPDCPQKITNTGDTDLVFLALCTPRFDPSNYRALE